MNNFFNLTNAQRKLVIEQTSTKMNDLHPQIVEKDLWVTTILQMSPLRKHHFVLFHYLETPRSRVIKGFQK